MNTDYAIFKYAIGEDTLFKKKFLRRMWTPKMLYRRILKKLPIEVEETKICGIPGMSITLPITDSILLNQSEEYIKTVTQKIFASIEKQYQLNMIILPSILERYVDEHFVLARGIHLKLVLLENIFLKVIGLINKPLKDLKVVIIDSEDTMIDYALLKLYSHLNFIGVQTSRKNYFDPWVAALYEENGLVLEVYQNPIQGEIHVDLVINLSEHYDKSYYYYSKNTMILDLYPNREKMNRILTKRKDMVIIDDFVLRYKGEEVSLKEAECAIFSQNRVYRNLIKHGFKEYQLDKIENDIKAYGLEISKLMQRRYE